MAANAERGVGRGGKRSSQGLRCIEVVQLHGRTFDQDAENACQDSEDCDDDSLGLRHGEGVDTSDGSGVNKAPSWN